MLAFLFVFAASVNGELMFPFQEEEQVMDQDYYRMLASIETLNNRDPIVLVPGFMSSRIEYSKASADSYSVIWVQIGKMLPVLINTFVKEFKIDYNPATDEYLTNSSFKFRTVDYGKLGGVRCLDNLLCGTTAVFKLLLEPLEKAGYKEGVDIFGAPYDFRVVTPRNSAQGGHFAKLKELVERAYNQNKGKRVHLITHSAGGIFTRYFLATFVDQAWKNKYVASFIPIAAPFGGATEALIHSVAHHKAAIPTLSAEQTYNLAHGFGQIHWLMPHPTVFGNQVLVELRETDGKTVASQWNAANVTGIWSTTGRSNVTAAVNACRRLQNEDYLPGVPMHVKYGGGVQTGIKYIFTKDAKKEWWQTSPKIETSDGDGTVPMVALKYPQNWIGKQQQPITVKQYPGKDHGKILGDTNLVNDILAIVGN